MTKIVIPDARTLLGQTREENQRLREELKTAREDLEDYKRQVLKLEDELAEQDEELVKVREVNAEQAKHIGILTAQRDEARENEEKWRARVLDLEGRLMAAQQARMARSGE